MLGNSHSRSLLSWRSFHRTCGFKCALGYCKLSFAVGHCMVRVNVVHMTCARSNQPVASVFPETQEPVSLAPPCFRDMPIMCFLRTYTSLLAVDAAGICWLVRRHGVRASKCEKHSNLPRVCALTIKTLVELGHNKMQGCCAAAAGFAGRAGRARAV